jgi:ribosomal protein S18 acetylase RimI-like enzyme
MSSIPGNVNGVRLRPLDADGDRLNILRLLTQDSFHRWIGDRGVTNEEEAGGYVRDGAVAQWASKGYGPCAVVRVDDGEFLGIAGLYQRPNLAVPDLGYAMLDEYTRRGYATAACSLVLAWAATALPFDTIGAITDEDNVASIGLLKKLGFVRNGCYSTDKGDIAFFERKSNAGPSS